MCLIELSLFSGIGGGLLGSLLLGWHTVAAVDFEPYCCEVLARRKQDGIFKEPFDIYCMDIGEFNRRVAPIYQGQVDIITAGFPCQSFSVAGKQLGKDDERNGFPALAETIRIIRPRYLFLENVPALLGFDYWGEILSTLSESGYDVRWKVISAGELGAPHRRDRLWIMGDTTTQRSQEGSKLRSDKSSDRITSTSSMDNTQINNEGGLPMRAQTENSGLGSLCQNVSDATGKGLEGQVSAGESRERDRLPAKRCTWWDNDPADESPEAESFLGRMVDGVPNWMDRVKAIGNGQVPAVVRAVWELMGE